MTRYGSESGAEALRNQETPCVHSLSLSARAGDRVRQESEPFPALVSANQQHRGEGRGGRGGRRGELLATQRLLYVVL